MERLTFKERFQNGQTITLTIVIAITTLLLLSKSQALFGQFGVYVLTGALIYSIGGLSVNLITGYCGQLSLGQAGFFAIGAYAAAIFSKFFIQCGLPIYVVIILGIIVGASVTGIIGYIIGLPTLRLSGDYLAIVTLGFAEIIRILIKNLKDITGGGIGLDNIPKFSTSRVEGTFVAFMWVLIVFILVTFIVMMFVKSGSGRRTVAVREDEIAANAMGVNIKHSKQTAFVLAAMIAGVGGAIFAFQQGSISPGVFDFQMSVDFLIIAVFGGLGSFSGTILAGVVLTTINQGVLPSMKAFSPFFESKVGSSGIFDSFMQVMSWLMNNMENLRLPIYALILIVVMVYRPKGLLGTKEWSVTKFWNNVFGINKIETIVSEDGGTL